MLRKFGIQIRAVLGGRGKNLRGIYVLVIKISKAINVKIGGLGCIDFSEGLYAYVGSSTKQFGAKGKEASNKK